MSEQGHGHRHGHGHGHGHGHSHDGPACKRVRVGDGEECCSDEECAGPCNETDGLPRLTDEDIANTELKRYKDDDGKIDAGEGLDFTTKVYRKVFNPAREVFQCITTADTKSIVGPLT